MIEMRTEILIVGAGPAGLAMAGQLRHYKKEFVIIEASDRVSPAWHQHYDRLHLHTVSQWSHLPHKPFPEDIPLYVPKEKLIAYFDSYAKEFNIDPIFNQKALSVEKKDGSWQVLTADRSITADKIVIATGVNRIPNIPSWPGMDSFEGEVLHSRFYKNASPYIDQKVLVVGMGNTGAELALDLSEQQIETYLSVRSPISVVPRDLNGRPVQVTSKQLQKLPFGLGGWLGTQIRKVYFGDLTKYGLPVSKADPVKQLLTTGKTPIVDIGTIDAIKKGAIHVRPTIAEINPKEVVFSDGRVQPIDTIVLATGYKAQVQEFFPAAVDMLDKNSLPNSPIGTGTLEGAYFLGFDNYKLGGILGTIYNDSATIANHIVQ